MAREPLTIVEMDMGICGRVFGQGACTATLGPMAARKCYNTYATCRAKAAFLPTIQTLRFCEARGNLPALPLLFPALLRVSEISASVNIAGADDRAGPIGRRASVEIELQDFAHHDRGIDPYQSERVTGAAQLDGVGYDPSRGTFFGKLGARWPHFTGRAVRIVQGYIEGGAFVPELTRAYVLTDRRGPDDAGRVIYTASDVFYLADTALCPRPSAGALAADITAGATGLTLLPAGIGDAEYPASGRACIGAEIVDYTRAGDAITLTGRGLRGTAAESHSAGDTFQQVYSVTGAAVDTVCADLLGNYAAVPAAMIPSTEWAQERARWLGHIKLTTDICQPVKVSQLLGELAVLGFSLFPDVSGAKIKLRANRPIDGDAVFDLTDRAHLKSAKSEDRQDRRLTEVLFFSVQIDPTKSAGDIANFRRVFGSFDFDAKGPNAYGDTKARRIFSRWLNDGGDNVIRIISARLLKRFVSPPAQWRVKVDAKDAAIGLADVVQLQTAGAQDETGAAAVLPMQVVARGEVVAGHEIELTLQAYDFAGRYGFATENTRPSYSASNDGQRARGAYLVGASGFFADGTGPYEVI